ncbi:MAG TPA: hypothetical protein VFR33_07415 [Candidatus Dormibacteraeota bacterium]|nr:hypothetical protein [Candidatus Dormibacteraeota bacterium]
MTQVLIHGFGPRYDLPIATALYLYAAGGVVFISFVLVVLFAGDRVGPGAVNYPRRAVPWLLPAARSSWPRIVGGLIGVLSLVAVVVTGFFGDTSNSFYNPSEYIVWIFFWAWLVVLTGLVGNLFYFLNPWTAIYDALARLIHPRPLRKMPDVGWWPAAAAYFAFACLELTTGLAVRPQIVAAAAIAYTLVTVGGMFVFGREEWLDHCEAFTILFRVIARFGPIESERDETGQISAVYVRPWGVGLLQPVQTGWDRVLFVILMLSTLAFDGISATPAWQDFTAALKPYWLPLGSFGLFAVRTFGLVLLTIAFLLIFVAFMEAVMYLGKRKVDARATATLFALTLVPIALVYNAAHNYSYIMVQSQYVIPLLNDPLHRGADLLPALANYTPNFALAQASTVWYADIVLIVLGHVIAVFLSHLRAGERFRTAQRALLSQYPMLLLMVMYTMTSLWILAQPITKES